MSAAADPLLNASAPVRLVIESLPGRSLVTYLDRIPGHIAYVGDRVLTREQPATTSSHTVPLRAAIQRHAERDAGMLGAEFTPTSGGERLTVTIHVLDAAGTSAISAGLPEWAATTTRDGIQRVARTTTLAALAALDAVCAKHPDAGTFGPGTSEAALDGLARDLGMPVPESLRLVLARVNGGAFDQRAVPAAPPSSRSSPDAAGRACCDLLSISEIRDAYADLIATNDAHTDVARWDGRWPVGARLARTVGSRWPRGWRAMSGSRSSWSRR